MNHNANGLNVNRSALHSLARREFLFRAGSGFAGTALAWLLARDGFFESPSFGAEAA